MADERKARGAGLQQLAALCVRLGGRPFAVLTIVHALASAAGPIVLAFAATHAALAATAAGALGAASWVANAFLAPWARDRTRPAVMRHAAWCIASDPDPERNAEAALWGAMSLERAIVLGVPGVVAAGVATMVVFAAAVAYADVRWVVSIAAAAVAALVGRRVAQRQFGVAFDAEYAAHSRLANVIEVLVEGRGEIRDDRAVAAVADTVASRGSDWARVERVRENSQRIVRLATLAAGIVGAGLAALLMRAPFGSVLHAFHSVRAGRFEEGASLVLVVSCAPYALYLARALDALRTSTEHAMNAGVFEVVTTIRPTKRLVGNASVRASKLGVSFGPVTALDDVSLELSAPGLTVVAGPNGCGKTTFARALLGLVEQRRGSLQLDGLQPDDVASEEFAFFAARPVFLRDASVYENIRLAATDATPAEMIALLRELGFGEPLERKISDLSLGQQRRVAIARTLLRPSALVVLDEPDSALDGDGRRALVECLVRRAARGHVVVVSHRREVMERADRIVVLNADHRVDCVGSFSEVLLRSTTLRSLVAVGAESAA